MEDIDLKELYKYYMSKILIVIVFMVLGLTACMLYTMCFKTPLYQSYTTLILVKEESENSITVNDISLNDNLVDTYSELIKSKKIARQVINQLGLNMSASELVNKINVSSVNNTQMIKIVVTDTNPDKAQNIANEIAKVFEKEVLNYYKLSNVGIVDEAEKAESPYNINLVKDGIIGILAGFVLGSALVLIIFYFDTTIKKKEDIEEKLGISVLGLIPHAGGKN